MIRPGEVEFNYTWYRMARAEAVMRMAAKAPDLFYDRFYGRNTAGWHTSNMQKFDYDYTVAELQEIIFFNNHDRAQAPGNARELPKIPGE